MFGTFFHTNLNHLCDRFLFKIVLFTSHTCCLYQHLFIWEVWTFNIFSHTFVNFTIVVLLGMISHNTLQYYLRQLLLGSFNPGVFVLGVLFLSLLKLHLKVWRTWIIVLCTLMYCFFYKVILLLLFMTNFLYGHCNHVGFNTVSVMGRHIE